MTTPDSPAAVQIAAGALRDTSWTVPPGDAARTVVAALARAGWLHDPAYVAALEGALEGALATADRAEHEVDAARARIAAVHELHSKAEQPGYTAFCDFCGPDYDWPCATARALDAVPTAAAETGSGDDESRCT